MPINIPFKIETRDGCSIGYPFINWEFDGIRYEALLDTGADNIVFPLDFLITLEQQEIIKIEDLYSKNKFKQSKGIGGEMLLTDQIPIDISLLDSSNNIISKLNININCCIPNNYKKFRSYLELPKKIKEKDQMLRGTRDTRFRSKLIEEYKNLLKEKSKFNIPYLFGKPFISRFKYIKFVISDETANNSYYEFELK